MMSHHSQEMKELQDILYAMKLTYTERETDAAHSFESLMDELKNKVKYWKEQFSHDTKCYNDSRTWKILIH